MLFRLMREALRQEINKVDDSLSRAVWYWLHNMMDSSEAATKTGCMNDRTYYNDFRRYPPYTPKELHAVNDWRKSGWKLELERLYKMYKNYDANLLLPGELERIEDWINTERYEGAELVSSYDETQPYTPTYQGNKLLNNKKEVI
jgi:hypothetical protein